MQVLSTKVEKLPTPGSPSSFIKLGSVKDGLKEYLIFFDQRTRKVYIEEIWRVNLQTAYVTPKAIEDDMEWYAVYNFVKNETLILDKKRLSEFGIKLLEIEVDPELHARYLEMKEEMEDDRRKG